LDKAVYRIEQEIKKSKTHNQPNDTNSLRLRHLLSEAQEILPKQPENNAPTFLASPRPKGNSARHHDQTRSSLPAQSITDENFSVDDAENPLQLLARASDLSLPSGQEHSQPFASAPPLAQKQGSSVTQNLEAFFGPFRPSLDVGEDIDPIDMGLVTLEETDMLFT